ncbi:MAG: hypothetical protein SO122_07030 [Eubacteriales bacterium]|nr:hypothetical protein [Eubacteriales bacterium]
MRGINTEKYLSLYRELKISKSELQQAIGEGLHNVECKKAYCIKRSDVVNAIQLLQNGTISKDTLLEWVNIVWFTELFVFDDEDADSIVSVLEVLETMDEDGVVISENELSEMITALSSNTEYTPS